MAYAGFRPLQATDVPASVRALVPQRTDRAQTFLRRP